MGAIIVLSGLVSLLIAPFVGKAASFTLWEVEPLTNIGGVLLVVGLAIASLSYLIQHLTLRKTTPQASDSWSKLTQQYFEMFSHDLGRPLRRDCPDQTDSSNHVTLWDGSSYKRAA